VVKGAVPKGFEPFGIVAGFRSRLWGVSFVAMGAFAIVLPDGILPDGRLYFVVRMVLLLTWFICTAVSGGFKRPQIRRPE
jgi:hypothetical protein